MVCNGAVAARGDGHSTNSEGSSAVKAPIAVILIRHGQAAVGVALEGHTVQGIVGVVSGDAATVGLGDDVAVGIVSVANCVGFRVGRAGEPRQRIVLKAAGVRTVLQHTCEVVEHVVGVGRHITQAAGSFRYLGQSAETIGARRAHFAGGISDGAAAAGIGGGGS